MQGAGVWRLGQALMLGAALAITAANTAPIGAGDTPVVLASVAQGNDNGGNQGNDDDQDHNVNGQILEINTLKEPPELIVGTADGEVLVRVYKTDEIAKNGLRLGDHIRARGEKVHELLFDAQELSVAERYRGERSSGAAAGAPTTATPAPTSAPTATPTRPSR